MRVALIFNPRSGRGRLKTAVLQDVLVTLKGAGMEADAYPTEGPGHAIELGRQASKEGYERVIAWGGDGTLNEVASALVGTDTVLGVLPGGTVNVFARETGIPLKLPGAIEALSVGRVTRIPVGLAGDRPFLLMAGVGLDAEVVYRLKAGFKSALGALAFWLDGFRLLARYPMAPIRIHYDGKETMGSGMVAGKIRRYGPRYFITPEARLEEPMLHVVVFKGTRRRDYLRYLAGVVGRVHLRFVDVEHVKTDRLTVESDARVPYQLDGEFAGYTPVSLSVRDRALAVVLPPVKEIE